MPLSFRSPVWERPTGCAGHRVGRKKFPESGPGGHQLVVWGEKRLCMATKTRLATTAAVAPAYVLLPPKTESRRAKKLPIGRVIMRAVKKRSLIITDLHCCQINVRFTTIASNTHVGTAGEMLELVAGEDGVMIRSSGSVAAFSLMLALARFGRLCTDPSSATHPPPTFKMASETQVWNSDDDESDAHFGEQDTVATLPLTLPEQRLQTLNGASSYVTQPTQPLARSSPNSSVLVPASSPPPRESSPHRPSATQIHSIARNRSFASAMAPPGTEFRSPAHGWQTRESQAAAPDFTQTSQIQAQSDSSDDEDSSRNNIRPTSFDRGQPAQRVEDSPRSAFGSFASPFAYNPSVAMKRSADDMANGYGSSRRPKAARLDEPAQKPPGWKTRIQDFDDIPDIGLREKARRIKAILPKPTVLEVYEALLKNRGDEVNTQSWLADEEERRENRAKAVDLTKSDDELKEIKKPQQVKPGVKRGVQGQVRSINQKWSQASRTAPPASDSFIAALMSRGQEPPKPQEPMKRQPPPSKSIAEKWSSTARPQAERPSEEPMTPEQKKPRRRLVQGRKNPVESSPINIASPVGSVGRRTSQLPGQQPKQIVTVIESDQDDSGVGSGSEDQDSAEDGLLDAKILSFINTCTLEDLIDVSSQPPTNAGKVLEERPYSNMEEVRRVIYETASITKTGKTRVTKQPVGQRLCDVLEEMFEGYDAVDDLVSKCEELGRPVAAEMKHWGFDAFGTAREGELSLVDLHSAHDSGIGTPASSAGSNADEPDEGPRSKPKGRKLLQQPAVMSSSLVMKDYQVAGLNWLALLYSKNLSCILADDMGLGKTCQVISFLAHLFEANISKGPHLIIVPGSTLENWLREFKNFCPALKVEPYYGKQSERADKQLEIQDQIDSINVIVTTYDMASKRDDAAFLRKRLRPVVCVYDEGHALKNSQSQRYKELMRIPAQFRLLLTGTPLQNNLQELISLLAFIMPAIFTAKEEVLTNIFKHRAKTTDTEHTALLNAERISKARSMMTPFILRRKKHQVLKDIPKKTTTIVYCDLAPDQRVLYDERRAAARSVLLGNGGEEDGKKKKRGSKNDKDSVKLTNNIMMDLRKAAIHPLLFRRLFTDDIINDLASAYCKTHPQCGFNEVLEDLSVMTDFELNRWCKNEDNSNDINICKHKLDGNPWMQSGKVAKLIELLKGFIKNGDRTLVFSQFTMVMDVLELVFETEEVGFYRLDGSTLMQTRQDLLDQFHDDGTPVFMLSTKAGGAGINLACANKVIIFDMSFNPQDDVQAENRAHRVGQKREVEVVRLVSRDTIEEQILRLGESKLALDAQVAGEGEAKASDEGEKKGAALIEAMMKEQLVEGVEASSSVKNEEALKQDKPNAEEVKAGDIKADYLDGLKAAGLDMSAATE
ncbi:hypothetical protein FH972_025939 [Carpinus fangiana]|uniref:DNA helicase n=1 Tax=Carpinus fangiana TaxID=176857 RepID=A0A5N6L309_9ROSI|nr:hypothetical protein FH972_025939 [Carpinus fangiana]